MDLYDVGRRGLHQMVARAVSHLDILLSFNSPLRVNRAKKDSQFVAIG